MGKTQAFVACEPVREIEPDDLVRQVMQEPAKKIRKNLVRAKELVQMQEKKEHVPLASCDAGHTKYKQNHVPPLKSRCCGTHEAKWCPAQQWT